MYSYGFRRPIFHMMIDHSENGWQCVFDNERFTEKLPVTTGVSQGSILESFLSLVYINDMADVSSTKSKIAILADNSSLFQSGKQNL